MKTIFFTLLFICFTCLGFAQSNTAIVVSGNAFYQLPAQQAPKLNFIKNYKTIGSFSIYNNITGSNDSFINSIDSKQASQSTFIFQNQYRGVKIDSFNPHGAQDFGNALISGLVSLLF